MEPFISIIVPNYNHRAFLKQRLESVFNQSYQNFEVILLDDASSDDSLHILNQYAKNSKTSHYIINDVNSGSLFKQWAKGILLAKGHYIWIAESDDFAHIDFLKDTIAIANQFQNLGMVFTDSVIVDQKGNAIGQSSIDNKLLAIFKEVNHYKIEDRNKVLNNFVDDLIIWNASSVLFNKEAIENVDFALLQSLKNAGDLFTYISIALKYDILYLNKPLNNFRKHGANTTIKNLNSGMLFKDRLIIILFYLDELTQLSEANKILNSFLRRNFLTAVDFKFYRDVQALLKAYSKHNIISFISYLSLSTYVHYCKIFGYSLFSYRRYIKKVLMNNYTE